MKQAGVKDVARMAGVSLGTVSHVLNHPERVTQALRDRVHDAIETLHFVRNGAASQLRAGRRTAIGLVVPDISNPFFADVARGAEDEADAHGYSVLICNAGESSPRQQRHLQFLLEERVGGVLLTETFRAAVRRSVPKAQWIGGGKVVPHGGQGAQGGGRFLVLVAEESGASWTTSSTSSTPAMGSSSRRSRTAPS